MPARDRWTAVLLAIEALLVVSPVLAVSQLFTGAQLLGKSAAYLRVPDLGAQGAVLLLGPLLVLLLLLSAWGAWHGSRGVGALLLQLLVAAHGLVPFLQPMTTAAAVPYGSWLLVGVAVGATVLLIRRLLAPSPDGPGRHRRGRWWWVLGFAVAVAVLAGIGATSRSLPFDPTARLLPAFDGTVPPSAGDRGPRPPQNPGLAADPWNSIHNDSWATDAYALAPPADPASAPVDTVFTGGDCATITFDSRRRLVTLCSTLTRVVAYLIDPDTLEVLAQQVVGTRSPDPTDFSSGGYFFLDDADRIVMPTADGAVLVLSTGDDEPLIAQEARLDVSASLKPGEHLIAVMPDWQRRYWFAGNRGTVGIVDPAGGPVVATDLGPEAIDNSFAVTADAAYIVTQAALYRLAAAGDGPPEVVWRTPYDTGERRKPGQAAAASGTTPTIFAGGRLVAITDNAEPRMNVVVLRTGDGRVTCTTPVFADGHSATENSLIAASLPRAAPAPGEAPPAGRSRMNDQLGAAAPILVVENNDGYSPPITATSGGHTTSPGITAVAVRPADGSCRLSWTTDEVSVPSAVSKASLPGGQILTYSKPAVWWGADGWYLTAVDLATGQPVWRRLAGAGLSYNNHYAAVTLGPGGDLYVGTVHGIAVLRSRP